VRYAAASKKEFASCRTERDRQLRTGPSQQGNAAPYPGILTSRYAGILLKFQCGAAAANCQNQSCLGISGSGVS
jgi:hypothetical protein